LADRKGEAVSTNPGDVSTAVSEANEERGEPRESRVPRAFYT